MGTIFLKKEKARTYPHNPQVILASSSKWRKALLQRNGIEVLLKPSDTDETKIKKSFHNKPSQEMVLKIACEKALAVSQKYPDFFVLAADQILDCGGILLNKPLNLKEVEASLRFLMGKKYNLMTAAVVFLDGKPFFQQVVEDSLKMRYLKEEELQEYIEKRGKEVIGCLGAHEIENKEYDFVTILDGNEESIQGLPLEELKIFLKENL